MTIKPMLAQSTDVSKLVVLAADPGYCFQQKLDGYRIMVHVTDRNVSVLNRNGESSSTELPADIRIDLARLPMGEWVLDCELMAGKTLWVFDMPKAAHLVEPSAGFTTRHFILESLFKTWKPTSAIKLLPVALDRVSKLRLAETVIRGGGEGLIAKKVDGRYVSGKRTPAQLKLKFRHDVDCFVTDLGREGKQNIGLGLWDGDRVVDVGEVTSLAGDGPRVKVGDVVTVRYLYCLDSKRPRLVQPTSPTIRDDKPSEQCTINQLHYTNKAVLTEW